MCFIAQGLVPFPVITGFRRAHMSADTHSLKVHRIFYHFSIMAKIKERGNCNTHEITFLL